MDVRQKTRAGHRGTLRDSEGSEALSDTGATGLAEKAKPTTKMANKRKGFRFRIGLLGL